MLPSEYNNLKAHSMKIFACSKLKIFVISIFSLANSFALAEQILLPTLDGFIRSKGDIGWFNTEGILIGDTGASLEDRYMNGLLKFDLSGLVAGREIASVSLVLTSRGHPENESAEAVTFELRRCRSPFSPAATWENYAVGKLWEIPGGRGESDTGPLLSSQIISTTDYKVAGRTLEFPSTDEFVEELKRAHENGEPLYLWIALEDRESGGARRHILDVASTEYSNQEYFPQLIISYTSE